MERESPPEQDDFSSVRQERTEDQGDQIGQIFAFWGDCFLSAFLKIIYRRSPNFWAAFSAQKSCVRTNQFNFVKKPAWAILWAIFSQAHPVTLLKTFFLLRQLLVHIFCGKQLKKRRYSKTEKVLGPVPATLSPEIFYSFTVLQFYRCHQKIFTVLPSGN
jgi:hypothetical protein